MEHTLTSMVKELIKVSKETKVDLSTILKIHEMYSNRITKKELDKGNMGIVYPMGENCIYDMAHYKALQYVKRHCSIEQYKRGKQVIESIENDDEVYAGP